MTLAVQAAVKVSLWRPEPTPASPLTPLGTWHGQVRSDGDASGGLLQLALLLDPLVGNFGYSIECIGCWSAHSNPRNAHLVHLPAVEPNQLVDLDFSQFVRLAQPLAGYAVSAWDYNSPALNLGLHVPWFPLYPPTLQMLTDNPGALSVYTQFAASGYVYGRIATLQGRGVTAPPGAPINSAMPGAFGGGRPTARV